ncbi:MAG: PH domain-containing protein [Candidatus Nanohaloarchaea archaeon]|nr:PH domain-containing protein [Candidatus Nanohaloarchaea archaeon]
MASADELLEPGEKIIEKVRPSRLDWEYLKWYLIGFLFLALSAVTAFTQAMVGVLPFSSLWLSALFLATFILTALVAEVKRHFVEYYFTDLKLVEEVGIFNKDVRTVRYENVTDTHLDKDLEERIFGIGSLKVNTPGSDISEIVLGGLKDPEQFKSLIARKSAGSSEIGEPDQESEVSEPGTTSPERTSDASEDNGLESRIGEIEMEKSRLEKMFNRGELSEQEYREKWYLLEGREREVKDMLSENTDS